MNDRTRLLVLTLTVAASLAASACGEGSAPAAPTVDPLPPVTNQNPFTITGTAEAGALVQVRGGAGSPSEAMAASDGSFSVDATLTADANNTLLVSQTVGGLESEARMVRIAHDGTAPAAPSLDPVTSPTRRSMQRLRGTTEPLASVSITGGAADAEGTADDTGRFEIEVSLNESATDPLDNVLSVRATDVAGNLGEPAMATITFDSSIAVEAPLLDSYAGFTSANTVTLSGDAEAGVGISAVGGATDGMTTVGADGRFSVDVGLRPNQRNEILVFAVAGGATSPATSAVIVHDDVAPEAPNLDPQASPTGADLVVIAGDAEAGASIAITGGAADASGVADDAGRFAIDVMLTTDADNALSIIASDAAGNESAAALLTITQDSSLEAPIYVNPVTSPTSSPTVMLSGRATASIDIEITGGAATVMTTSDASGDWSATVSLRPNARNELRVTRPGSGADTVVVIEHDDIAPDAPSLNSVPSPTGSSTITVSGTSEPLARVSVSGGTSAASGTAAMDGRFSIAVTIAEDSESTLSAIATDRAGNSSSPTTVVVTHSSSVPDAPVVDQPNPAPTNMPTHVVTGHVTTPAAGIDILIRGGMADATGTTDPSTGVFSIEVTLRPNMSNALSVVSVTGSIESPPSLVTITHDDIAPASPVSAGITATAGGCVLGVPTGGNVAGAMSSVEARSTVRVTNVTRSTSATTSATDGGSFSVGLGACSGQVIRITATDAAGNTSDFVEVNAS